MIWEQNLTVPVSLSEVERYYILLRNPTEAEMPYYFVAQTVQAGRVFEAIQFTGTLPPGGLRYLPLIVALEEDGLGVEVIQITRQHRGKLNP